MACSRNTESSNLFTTARLEPLQKKQPVAEVLQLPIPTVNNALILQTCSVTKFWRFLYAGKQHGAHLAFKPDGDFPDNPCEHVVEQLIKNGSGMSVISSLYKVTQENNFGLDEGIAYTMAVCVCSSGEVKQRALQMLDQICTNPRLFLQAINKATHRGGWTKPIKKAVKEWYCNKRPYDVAFGVSSCPSFQHMNHSRLLRSCHVKPGESLALQMLTAYVARGYSKVQQDYGDQIQKSDDPEVKKLMEFLDAITKIKQWNEVDDVSLLIFKHKLIWGHLPHSLHKNEKIWQNALPGIPIDILICKLPDFHILKLIDGDSDITNLIIDRIKSEMKSSGLHPFRIFWHKNVYASGESVRGKKKWSPNNQILDALEVAFQKSLTNVVPTGKRICVTTDASKSMKGNIVNSNCLDCLTVAASMCFIIAKTERNSTIQGFSKKLETIAVSQSDTVQTVKEKISSISLGGTDCSRPMITAKRKNKEFDCFIVFTDNDTWKGKTSPSEALQQYREKTEIPARLIVVALAAKSFEKPVADENDRGMLDICGFGETTPSLISSFISGKF